MENYRKKIAVLTAGGKGTRMNMELPKQFIHVANEPVIIYTLEAFQSHPKTEDEMVLEQF